MLGVDAVRGLDPAQLFNLTPSGDANRMAAISDFANNPVGAGPFTLDEWIRDYRMSLVRNENYFQADRPSRSYWSRAIPGSAR